MSKNGNLHAAKRAKNDEFYTRRTDIEKEMVHYRKTFVGKTIFCNCDDPDWSNFWKYFYDNFDYLMLEGLISTHYETEGSSYKLEVYKDPETGLRGKVVKTSLIGNGDFRSNECVELLNQVDIVITNPPFSLFREYIAQLIEYDKKFIVIGNINAITYKEIFPLLRENKMWAGFGFNKTVEFIMPDSYQLRGKAYIDDDGRKHGFVPGVCWYTNLDIKKRHEELFLYRHYHGKDHDRYPKYDNYDAIEVSKVVDIPCDYDGVMGVPITFLDKFNPEQFEIVAFRTDEDGNICAFTRDEEREFNSSFLAKCDEYCGDNQECGRKDRWKNYLRTYHDSKETIEPIDIVHPSVMGVCGMMNNPNDTAVNGKKKYARILIRRKH